VGRRKESDRHPGVSSPNSQPGGRSRKRVGVDWSPTPTRDSFKGPRGFGVGEGSDKRVKCRLATVCWVDEVVVLDHSGPEEARPSRARPRTAGQSGWRRERRRQHTDDRGASDVRGGLHVGRPAVAEQSRLSEGDAVYPPRRPTPTVSNTRLGPDGVPGALTRGVRLCDVSST